MPYSYKPQKDSEFICTDDYCGIVFTSFNSAKVMLNSFNVVVVVDSYATCVKSHIDGYSCFSYKLRPIENLHVIMKDCDLLLFKPESELLTSEDICEGCFYFVSEETLDNLPLREIEEVNYV